jgi:Flp pilus assembly protein TadG
MATAEFAMVLPVLVLAVVTAVGGVVAVGDDMRCADAAATAARLAARGESAAEVRAIALRAAPHGATLQLVSDGTTVTATVTATLQGPGLLGRLPALTFTQRSVAALEVPEPAATK